MNELGDSVQQTNSDRMKFARFAQKVLADRDTSANRKSLHAALKSYASIYTTFAPCLICAKMIINSGIREVVYNMDYPLNNSAFRLFSEANLTVRQLKVD